MNDSELFKLVNETEALGADASCTGDPSLILSFCHEFYVLACELTSRNVQLQGIHDAVRLYNSGMTLEYAEYYLCWTYKMMKCIKDQLLCLSFGNLCTW